MAIATSTLATGGPQAPRGPSPPPNLMGASQIRRWITRSVAMRARVPIDVVDLVQPNIVAAVVVVVFSIRVAAGFCVGNAPAAVLRPVAVM